MSIWDDPAERRASWRAGGHDSQCEQRERSYICHCGKREREAKGPNELPTEDLYFPPPSCPVCDGDLEFDGDGFDCPKCHLSWNDSGAASSAEFTDDYGDDFGGEQFGALMRDVVAGRTS